MTAYSETGASGISGSGSDAEIRRLAEEVLDLARNRLLVRLRYLDKALSFHGRRVYDGSLGTDGRDICFDPVFVLKTYRASKEALTRSYLHMVLHCVFLHIQGAEPSDRRLWDLACDIAVECTIDELDPVCARTERDERQKSVIRSIRGQTGLVTAERIYRMLIKLSGEGDPDRISGWEELFRRDDHSLWYIEQEELLHQPEHGAHRHQIFNADDRLKREWQSIAEHTAMDADMFAKVRGKYAAALVQNLRAVTRERCDYSDFLRRFASRRERLRVNEDEFDYIYYNFGLTNYGNMPLIEPLEYREESRIHDFVIAVDTSGSVAGEEVQSFLRKTYNMLSSRESFEDRINVHIIQCDAEIQSDELITSAADLDRYMESMEIRGLGGTDFRPVFSYVDRLVSEGAFSDLQGLIYFTDGLGVYPERMPDYRSAFVFLETGLAAPEVPPWAIKLVLDADEL